MPTQNEDLTQSQDISRRDVLKLWAGLMAATTLPVHLVVERAVTRRIYIAPDDHTDLFWSQGENEYRNSFLAMLDYYLDLADSTSELPSDFQSRWNCDGSFWVWAYEHNRTPTQFQRLIDRIKDGHVSAPLNALVICLGGTPAEAVLRGMYYAGKLERQYDLRFSLAIAMENQTFAYGLPSLWAGSGAKYSWKGICGCDTKVSGGVRDHEIYYAGGLDGSRILMKWHSLLNANTSMGGYAEARDPGATVDFVSSDSEFLSLYPYDVIGAFGKGWDDIQTLSDEFVTVAQQKTNANRRVIVSNEADFFADFEATYGAQLPVVATSYGNDWDLYPAAMAEVAASPRRSIEKLRGAEAIASLVTLVNPTFMNGREEARDLAWMNLGLFWEHNWGVVARYEIFGEARKAWQRRLASEIKSYVDTLHTDAVAALGGLIQNDSEYPRLFVFNSLGYARTDAADFPYSDPDPVRVFDLLENMEVPSQIVMVDGQRRLRLLARDVPPIGYKVFELRPGTSDCFPAAADVNEDVIENNHYRIQVADRGAIVSLIDKTRNNREFVQTFNGRAINDLGAGDGTLQVENAGAVSVTLVAVANAPLQHTTWITLFREIDRIDLRNDITENFDAVMTWGFGFKLTAPDLWHEEVGAVIELKLLDNGGHYAGNFARYDWLSLNHFADLSGSGNVGITLSNWDCCFMKYGSSTPENLDAGTPYLDVLAGGRVGGDGSGGIPGQGGDNHFLQRFALQTHDTYNAASAMRFALQHQNPLIAGAVGTGTVYPELTYSLLSLSADAPLVWALKPADDNPGALITRFWNLTSDPVNFKAGPVGFNLDQAKNCTHIETPLDAAVTNNGMLDEWIKGNQIKTFLLKVSAQAFPSSVLPVPVAPLSPDPVPLPSPQGLNDDGTCVA